MTLKHLAALGIKYVMTFVVLLAFMSLGGSAPLATRAGLALALVVVNYLIGDLVILPATATPSGWASMGAERRHAL